MRSPPGSPPRSNVRGPGVARDYASGSPTHNRVVSLTTVPELDRPSSRNSVNFSYPRGSRPNSPSLPENRPISLEGTAVRDVSSVEVASAQQAISQMSEKPVNKRSKAPAAGHGEASPANKSIGLPVGTAIAAAQAVSVQKSSPRPEPDHARVERIGSGPSATSPQGQIANRSQSMAAYSSEVEHPSSRAVPGRWPSAVPEENKPKNQDAVDTSRAQDASNQLAHASIATEHREPAVTPQRTPQVTPQPSPKGEKQTTPQQEAHLQQSSSPGRSARFAKWLSVTAAGEQVHEPPPRSVSPVKSALKNARGNSLSPDGRAGTAGRAGLASSELSDGGTSVASDEGPRFGVKKRAVKVSFDDEAEVVGVAASPPTSPEEYVPESPPHTSKPRKNWFNVVKKKTPAAEFVSTDYDFDEVMKPRAALPSFGSVRGNRNGGSARPPIPTFSDNESSSSSEDEASAPITSFSNDHALAGVLRHEQKESSQPHDVKSVEQLSVVGSAPSREETTLEEASTKEALPEKELDGMTIGGLTEQQPYSGVDSQLHPPSIAVEPATPPVDDRKSFDAQRSSRSSLDQYQIPGGFPPSGSDRSLKSAAEADTSKSQPVASAIPKLDDTNKEYSDSVYTETDSDHGSVYSDAPEDPEDGDGFGSINAIVDSRSIPRSAPLEPITESRDTTPRPAERIAVVDNQPQGFTDKPSEVPYATSTKELAERQVEASPPASPMNLQPSDPPLLIKSKARPSSGSFQAENKQRRPMSVDTHGSLLNKQDPRYSSNAGGASKDKPRPLSLGPAFQVRGPGLRRTMSSGSDSSSSFKRASSATRSDGPHAMRRTMRASPTGGQPLSPSARNDSPIDNRPLSSGSNSGTMRKTLRSSGAGDERYSFFSTNKKAPRARFVKPPPKAMQGTRFADSDDDGGDVQHHVFRSRFADSSDEEKGPSNNTLRPVRGIPRRRGTKDGDSTELEDSSEGERHQQAPRMVAPSIDPMPPRSRDQNAPPNMSGMAAVARQRGMTQRELEEFLMQPSRGRRPSILTRLGLKKPQNADNRIRKLDVESPSRRDTPLERSRLERDQLREEPYTNGVHTTVTATQPEPPSSPKLIKRLTKRQTTGGQHWPLRPEPRTETPEPVVEQSHSLPSSPLQTQKLEPAGDTSGHNGSIVVNGSNAPGTISALKESEPLEPRRDVNDASSDITSTTNPEDQGHPARDVVIAGSGRKKRFPMLRKAFGLRK